jgi:hypothetical protein
MQSTLQSYLETNSGLSPRQQPLADILRGSELVAVSTDTLLGGYRAPSSLARRRAAATRAPT